MRTLWLIPFALPLIAAAPQRPLSLSLNGDMTALLEGTQSAPPGARTHTPAFQPAPLPNRDLSGPKAARASTEPTLSPTLFTNRTQFRGDGFSPGSTVQGVEENKIKPGAGFSLHMPFSPQ